MIAEIQCYKDFRHYPSFIVVLHVLSNMFQTVRINSVFEDHVVTQDITDDPERNTVLIVVGEAEDFKDFKPSVNLHDFNAVISSCEYLSIIS